MDKKYTTNSAKNTQKLGQIFAQNFLKTKGGVIALSGDLGSGKTTFLQGFAKGLKIKENILSPTFLIMKRFGNFYHFDCYRIEDSKEILELGFKKIISDPKNIVAIEWPEKIKDILPKNTIKLKFKFINKNTRDIIIYE